MPDTPYQDITDLYAYIGRDPIDHAENIIGYSGKLGYTYLFGEDLELLKRQRYIAETQGKELKQTVRLVRFSRLEVLEVIEPAE